MPQQCSIFDVNESDIPLITAPNMVFGRKSPTDLLNISRRQVIAHLDICARLLKRNLHALHAVGLPAAHAEQAGVFRDGDRVALHMLYAPPGKAQVFQLLRRRLRSGVPIRSESSAAGYMQRNSIAHRMASGRLQAAQIPVNHFRMAHGALAVPCWTLSQALQGTVATPPNHEWRPRTPTVCTHEKPCSSWACVRSTLSFVHRHACPGPDLLLRHHRELDVLRRQRIGLLLQPAACRSACTHRIRGTTQGPLRARSRLGAWHGVTLMRVCRRQRMTAATTVAGHSCCEGRTAGAHPWSIA